MTATRYAEAEAALQGDPIIQMIAASMVRVPLTELADKNGDPLSNFTRQAHAQYAERAASARARGLGDKLYNGPAHSGACATAVFAERAKMLATIRDLVNLPDAPEAEVMTAFDGITAKK